MWNPASRYWQPADRNIEQLATHNTLHSFVTARKTETRIFRADPYPTLSGNKVWSAQPEDKTAYIKNTMVFQPENVLIVEDKPETVETHLKAGYNVYMPQKQYNTKTYTTVMNIADLTPKQQVTLMASQTLINEPETTALRDNQNKPQLHYPLTLGRGYEELARVFEKGAQKYEPYNYLKGGKPDQEYLDSALRHITEIVEGEHYDQETGCHHAAHAAWNLLALIHLNHHKDK